AAYLARRGEPGSPDALAGHDCLAWHGAPPPGAWRFGERRHVPAQPRFRSNHSEALLEAAIDGLGLAHLPTWLAGDALRDGRLRAVLLEFAAAPEPATIHVLRQQARGTARASRLVGFLATWFAQPAWDAAWA
ncbi:LysR family transcriptional regulator, partial [Burkholderia sp. Ac-20384]